MAHSTRTIANDGAWKLVARIAEDPNRIETHETDIPAPRDPRADSRSADIDGSRPSGAFRARLHCRASASRSCRPVVDAPFVDRADDVGFCVFAVHRKTARLNQPRIDSAFRMAEGVRDLGPPPEHSGTRPPPASHARPQPGTLKRCIPLADTEGSGCRAPFPAKLLPAIGISAAGHRATGCTAG